LPQHYQTATSKDNLQCWKGPEGTIGEPQFNASGRSLTPPTIGSQSVVPDPPLQRVLDTQLTSTAAIFPGASIILTVTICSHVVEWACRRRIDIKIKPDKHPYCSVRNTPERLTTPDLLYLDITSAHFSERTPAHTDNFRQKNSNCTPKKGFSWSGLVIPLTAVLATCTDTFRRVCRRD
jgi:hypothetical protein